MKRGSIVGLIAVGAFVVSIERAGAVDEVFQKGKPNSAKGVITEFTKTSVTIKPRIGSALTIPANEIERVRWDGEPPKLNLARSAEAAGRLKAALDGYNEVAKDPKAGKEKIKIDIEFLIARTMGKLALTDPTKVDDAIQMLEALLRSQADHFHYYNAAFVLGQVYMAKKDYTKAKMNFDLLAGSGWKDYQMAANSASANLLLLQDDVAGALQAFQSVIGQKATTPAEKSRRYEAMLGKATCLARQQNYGDAVKALDEVVKQASPEDTRVQAEAYLRKGDCLQADGKAKEAILAYLHIPVLFSSEGDLHAESLHHLVTLWEEVGKPERAADARQELETRYPDTEWAKKRGGS